ncbi:MAG: amino acid ABC transporter substrate-binding protein [Alphaproteobacteria bacterium]
MGRGRIGCAAAAMAALLTLVAIPAAAGTLEVVRERGQLLCGVNTGIAGFAEVSNEGVWRGFDVDFCRAVAAAVLGDAAKVRFIMTTPQERFTALQSGEVDLLARNTTWTFSRDTNLGFDFVGVNYYDGQGFITPKALGVSEARQLDGARICVQAGTTTELNLGDWFRTQGLAFETIVIRTFDEVRTNYLAEACDAYTTDISGLAALRATFPDPGAHMILPQTISKEPLGPLVREGDDTWGDVVRWTLFALFLGEELGISRKTAEVLRKTSTNPEVRRLLGTEGTFGGYLGLSDGWAFAILSQVGHYGELFDRSLGKDSVLNLDRGLNRSWKDGGLHYAPPMR